MHLKVDALLGKANFAPDVLKGVAPAHLTNIAVRVFALIVERAPVERVYAIEDRIPAASEPVGNDPQVTAFCRDRLRVAVSLTADLFLTAWEDSADVVFPEWFDRAHARRSNVP